jgi:hypothetical protein
MNSKKYGFSTDDSLMDVQFGLRLKFIIPTFRFLLALLQLHGS